MNLIVTPIELGCSCKDDLAVGHKACAKAWLKIRVLRVEAQVLIF